jgi:hypothetical protein
MGGVSLGGRYRPRDVEGFLLNLSAVMKFRVVEESSGDDTAVTLEIHPAPQPGYDH